MTVKINISASDNPNCYGSVGKKTHMMAGLIQAQFASVLNSALEVY